MPTLNHTHTYQKHRTRKGYFRCADPACTHFTSKEDIREKWSRCNLCGEEFILTTEDLKRSKPRCINCSKTKIAIDNKQATNLVKSLNIFKEPEGI